MDDFTAEKPTGPTGTILDIHERRTGRKWWQRRPTPTALELAVAALEDCRRDQLDHKQKAEYHTAMEAMLRKRDERLTADIARLSAESGHGK